MKIKFEASAPEITWRHIFHVQLEKDIEEDYWICIAILGFHLNLRFFKKDSGWMHYYHSNDPYADMSEEDWQKA
jgi:hypothetical protein